MGLSYPVNCLVVDSNWWLIRINYLPVSTARWRHKSRSCFTTFIWLKVKKLLITQPKLKLDKKIITDFQSGFV